jgi:hypothetical protein
MFCDQGAEAHKACLKPHRFCFKFASEALPRYPSYCAPLKLPLHLTTSPLLCSVAATSTSLLLTRCAPLQLHLHLSTPPSLCSVAAIPLHLSTPPSLCSVAATSPLSTMLPLHRMYSVAATTPISLPLLRYDVLQLALHLATHPSV